MHQFFVTGEQEGRDFITITGQDAHHIKHVLRMKPGEVVRVSGECGSYTCSVLEFGEDFVQLDILGEANETELSGRIYLFQAIPKGARMESIIEKAVELGVYEIIPVAMKYCVVRLDEKKAKEKVRRWQAIAESAAKQSKRSRIPKVHPVMPFWTRPTMRWNAKGALCLMKMSRAWRARGKRFWIYKKETASA